MNCNCFHLTFKEIKVFFYPFVVVNCLWERLIVWHYKSYSLVIQTSMAEYFIHCFEVWQHKKSLYILKTLFQHWFHSKFIYLFPMFKKWQNRKTSNGKKTVLVFLASRRDFSYFLRVALCKVNNRFTLGFRQYRNREEDIEEKHLVYN